MTEVGIVGTMPGTTGFTMAVFKADEVPVGTRLYTHADWLAFDEALDLLKLLHTIDFDRFTEHDETALEHVLSHSAILIEENEIGIDT